MLVLNCSQAACDFFSRVQKGKKLTSVQQPPATAGEDELHTDSQQWLVHAATVQRKHVLLAIHLKTRYCMLFFGMKKADDEGFFDALIERWTAGMLDLALNCGVLDWINPQTIETLHRELTLCLVKRGDRSGQTHINQILLGFKWDAEDFDFVTRDWSALRYDAQTNQMPRSIKGQTGYRYPDEEMLIHWLITVGGVDASRAENARESYREFARIR